MNRAGRKKKKKNSKEFNGRTQPKKAKIGLNKIDQSKGKKKTVKIPASSIPKKTAKSEPIKSTNAEIKDDENATEEEKEAELEAQIAKIEQAFKDEKESQLSSDELFEKHYSVSLPSRSTSAGTGTKKNYSFPPRVAPLKLPPGFIPNKICDCGCEDQCISTSCECERNGTSCGFGCLCFEADCQRKIKLNKTMKTRSRSSKRAQQE